MDVEPDDLPPGPVVVLAVDGDGFCVMIEPPLSTGDHRSLFATRDAAWAGARVLWTQFRLGLRDDADPKTGNHNAASQRSE